jgi:shikimate kinase
MGAGKTTIGRKLARQLGMDFYDSDHEIERCTGVDIPLIFEIEGEIGFRKRERKVIDDLTSLSGIILATGGGAVLEKVNRKSLSENGLVIYLKASAERLMKRTGKDNNRPILQTEDPLSRIRCLLDEREPLYREVSDLIIDTDGLTVRQIIHKITGHQVFK